MLIVLFIIGLVAGSFFNLCIHRLPRSESIVFPASHCPSCGHRLNPIDLIPVLGYLVLAGKCRYCHAPISFRYPLVELLTGGLFVLVALHWPPMTMLLQFSFYIIFVGLLIILFFMDLEHQVISDFLCIIGIVSGLAYHLIKSFQYHGSGLNPFLSALYGMMLGWGILFLISRLGKLVFKKEAMGEGDLYLAAMIGAYLGWQGILLSIFLAYLVAAIVVVVMLIFKKVSLGQYVAFGPALAVGGLLTLFLGQQIIEFYLRALF